MADRLRNLVNFQLSSSHVDAPGSVRSDLSPSMPGVSMVAGLLTHLGHSAGGVCGGDGSVGRMRRLLRPFLPILSMRLFFRWIGADQGLPARFGPRVDLEAAQQRCQQHACLAPPQAGYGESRSQDTLPNKHLTHTSFPVRGPPRVLHSVGGRSASVLHCSSRGGEGTPCFAGSLGLSR